MSRPTRCTSFRRAASSDRAGPSLRTSWSAKAMRRRPRDDHLRHHPWLHRLHARHRRGPRQSRPCGRRHGAARDPLRDDHDHRHRLQPVHGHRRRSEIRGDRLRGGLRARRALRIDGSPAAAGTRQEIAPLDEEARMTAPFPTRKQEDWRYADLDALQPVWEQFAEPSTLTVASGETLEEVWLPTGDDVSVKRVRIALGEGAKARLFALNTATVYGRIELDVSLEADADFALYAANIGNGQSTNEVVTNVTHLGERGRSRQTVRSVLGGKAVGSYLGKVEVARGAQQTDGEQCAHGASVGELDPVQMFYAQSRGLDPASARALLLEGFVMGLWDAVRDETQREAMCKAARDALQRVAR